MNIKSLTSSIILPVDPKSHVDAHTRAQASADRDADGRREQAAPELKRHLTDDELADAIKALEENPGLKANGLLVKVESKADCRVILIVDPTGKTVRRLSEAQLWASTRDKDKHTGKILDKAM